REIERRREEAYRQETARIEAEVERRRREEEQRIRKEEQERIRREKEIVSVREELRSARQGLKCLEEGKRKFPRMDLDCNGSFMIGTRDSVIERVRKNVSFYERRLGELGASE
ncbi:MAG: hypothetical protein AB1346_05250, partial [Thermodesulfobacteriota bacterium]